MSTFLELICSNQRPNGHDPFELLKEMTEAISQRMADFRLIHRPTPDGIRIEPFSGAASFAALCEIPLRRTETLATLREMSLSCFLSFESVCLTKYNANHPTEAAYYGTTSIDDALKLLLEDRAVTVELDPTRLLFQFREVEARLFAPIVGPDGAAVSGFFCTMEAVALNEKEGVKLIAGALTTEEAALVGWSDIEIVRVCEAEQPRGYRVGGRAFFDAGTTNA